MTERYQEGRTSDASFSTSKRLSVPDTINVPVGGREYLPDGSEISAVLNDELAGVIPNETDYHETEHSVAGIEDGIHIKKVTTIAGPGYLGLTEPASFSTVAAVAPHANGRGGTSHDLFVAEMMGADVDSAEKVARDIIAQKEDHIGAVARHLHVKRTLTGSEVEAIMDDVDKGDKVDVVIKRPNGEVRRFPGLRTHESTIMIPDEWVVPQPA